MRIITSFGLILILLLLNTAQQAAQDNPDSKKIRIKMYVNGFYRYAEGTDPDDPATEEINISFKKERYDFGNLSVAIEIMNNKFLNHEFELMPVRISHDDEIKITTFSSSGESEVTSGGKSTLIESAFRYQANHYFNKDRLLVPQISFASQLYYNYSKYNPATARTFPATEQNVGLLLSFIPGLTVNIKKIAFDLNVPFSIYDFGLTMTNNENPALSEQDQKNSSFSGDFIPDYIYIRIGIIFKL